MSEILLRGQLHLSVSSFTSFLCLSLIFTLMSPAIFLLLTTSTSCPLNSFISGCVKGWSEVASPLHAATNFPAPLTSKVRLSSAVGTMVPFLSLSQTVMKARSLPLGLSTPFLCSVHTLASREAGVPAVFLTVSPIFFPSLS